MMADTESIEQLDTVDNAGSGSIYRTNFTSVSAQQQETEIETDKVQIRAKTTRQVSTNMQETVTKSGSTQRKEQTIHFRRSTIIVESKGADTQVPIFERMLKSEDDYGKTFRECDNNGNNTIEPDELKKNIPRILNIPDSPEAESLIEESFEKADENHDGHLNKSEFKNFFSELIEKMAEKLNYKTIPNIVFKKEMPWSMVILSVVLVLLYWCNSENPDLVEFLKLYPCLNNGEIWRLLTYMLVHADMIHLIHNITIQILSGFCFLEANNKRYQVFIIYFAGIILGGLGHIIFSDNNLVGCSGGVYALIGAIVSYILLNFRNLQQTQHGYCVLVIVLIFLGFEYMSPHTNTSHPAHIFGGISGLLLGFSILENKEKLDWEGKLILLAKILFGILVVILIFLVVMKNYQCCPGGCNEKWIH